MLSKEFTKVFHTFVIALYTSCLFSMFPNEDIVDIEKLDAISSLTFAVHEFSGLCFRIMFQSFLL